MNNTQTLSSQLPPVDVSSSGFRLTVCDGPTLPPGQSWVTAYKDSFQATYHRQYVACDFNGAMMQVQHLIDVALVAGVLLAIAGFCYAGFLYITHGDNPGKRDEAKDIFKKIFVGFIIMLAAWFVVYQVLAWLTGANSGFTSLLGKPTP
ncbi:MAG: hypothetical protein KGI45_02320 [Patescibacteria group bacterium]|nr:hypothetical protein [Patescibacteria group bacterium]MDE1940638.1 hypothetical protein [Patescibacteria group bacterium]MDE1966886.1 hypothetical protein [Patescibacteria group bacterium]